MQPESNHDHGLTATTKAPPVLEVKNLSVRFPIRRGFLQKTVGHVHAVDNVSFRLAPGEALGLVGESGSGKTTIGRTIVRLQEASAGTIHFHGKDLAGATGQELRQLRQKLQIVFQDPYASLNPRLRIGEALMEPLLVHGLVADQQAARHRAIELLQLVGLEAEHLNRWPHAFSGGQRQRIGIARALSLNPECLICDEPVSALDVSVQAQVMNLLMDLQRERGLSLLFIAHDLAVVGHLCQRVAVLYGGELVEIGPATAVLNEPLHPYTKSLLSAIPPDHPTQRRAPRQAPLTPPDITRQPSAARHRQRFPDHAAAFADANYGWHQATPDHGVRCSDLEQLLKLRAISE